MGSKDTPIDLFQGPATFKAMWIKSFTLPILLLSLSPAMAQVDLHAHLYMKPGLGLLLQGGAKSNARARSPDSRLDTKASETTLLSIGAPRITVVSLYAHPWLSRPFDFHFHENVSLGLEAGYQNLQEFVRMNPDRVVLARDARAARTALKEGKRVLILSIEGAYGALETEDDFKKWVDDRGLAILTPFHLTEDYFGGSALMSPLLSLFSSPLSFLQSVLLSGGSCLQSHCSSPMGMKPAGRDLIARLVERRVWVDLAHANDLERRELLPEFQRRSLPLLVSHSTLMSSYPAERSLSKMEIDYLKNTGGIVGLIPSDDYLNSGEPAPCFSGLQEFKKQIQSLEMKIGKNKVMIGSDFNAPLKGLSPACQNSEGGIQGTFESTGFFKQDQFKALSDFVASEADWTVASEEAFLSAWEKIR
jgi:microsomal dipeptidase-like Zn-dependent dipeptidase